MRIFTLLGLLLLSTVVFAQTTTDFENFNLTDEQFLNNSGDDVGFFAGHIFLPNAYNTAWMAWSGWGISNTTDISTAGFTNDGSSASGNGANGSSTYAVAYTQGGESVMTLTGDAAGGSLEGFYINNGTYAHLSIRDGDGFTKKFGGETGDDPDYFLLTIRKYLDGELSVDSVNYYLADFRFEDNSLDYIVTEWSYVDLTSLGNIDSLSFRLSSTDNGDFGMNTPAYFCIDDFTTSDMVLRTSALNPTAKVNVFPNPTTEFITIDWQESTAAIASLYNLNGQLLQNKIIQKGSNTLKMSHLPKGPYLLKLTDAHGVYTQKVMVK